MADPVDKATILRQLAAEYARFQALIAPLSAAQLQAPGVVGDWSIKDVVAHFIAHEQFALRELAHALRGETYQEPPAQESINDRAVRLAQRQPLQTVLLAWQQSHRQVAATVAALSEADFDPAGPVVQALGDTIDGALANNTYEHYAEHLPEIAAWIARQ